MHELVIASNNNGKIVEIRRLIPDISLLSLKDIGFTREIPEPFHTFRENAFTKADTIYRAVGKSVFADDSGICVGHLNGAPGVNSAHYSGKRDDEANLQLLLQQMEGVINRTAWYTAIICLIWDGDTHYFEGKCEGTLLEEKRGNGGFGYDPIFVPDGYDKTFAELPLNVKNEISHRGKAVKKMVHFIEQQIIGNK